MEAKAAGRGQIVDMGWLVKIGHPLRFHQRSKRCKASTFHIKNIALAVFFQAVHFLGCHFACFRVLVEGLFALYNTAKVGYSLCIM